MKDHIQRIFTTTDWRPLRPLRDWVISQGMAVQSIPAPTFAEAERADYVEEQFHAFGLTNVDQDDLHNVYGLLPGLNRSVPALLVTAHTDTVFAAETDLTLKREDDVIYGPGLGDNSMGVAGLMGLIKWLVDHRITPECDIWFVATVGEEGLGDLRGMRAAFERLKKSIGAVVNLEGLAYGFVYNAGIAVHRVKISASAGGGHSWVHYGRESALHALVQLASHITHLNLPASPRTSLNIGMIEGGQAINAIASSAHFWLDMRSESQIELDRLKGHIHQLVNISNTEEVQFSIEVVGDRPAGQISVRHPLIEGSIAALDLLGVKAGLEKGSTDGNVPLSVGCPTVTIGITRGANAHRLDEYIEPQPVMDGMQQLIMICLGTTAYLQEQYEEAAGD
ncbi:M20/M25/M40 family metallo-hydrolase [Phototrophicus methaneseepsis]|uniref:M20/M25/M40 family metallo-hydrolase n=1 Tax=Phototrophicus methaneseepsis TaxID=2710758 RepID=A0A7S8E512_9CHLR|nr:M20/M25/M40 family metallo-hydrolase [Phototrophicus methaneseepsis]QPC80496.1 M20/M25/M40 family metallo-hydrolase [Phototrophicus methaneseepsis]